MTVQVCKFRVSAEEKYDVHTCNVAPNAGERVVYRKVMTAVMRTLLFYLFKGPERKGPDEIDPPAGSCTGLKKGNVQNLREPHTQGFLSIK